ncbi:hypothetical protein CF15_01360 [Pyrodictium occultum]|uniref:DNA-binding protein n=1 Tax=Pyrodictium occultum TaxID=2309 RepID=A0A0V8RTW9_PYROC|nr:hypothetical protein [Pyrodictium occultum]KSW11518.1 hypothetical protein CF15_01360 [Pyrodictium occultum]
MTASDTWRSLPLHYAIIEELERKGGSAKDVDLYKALRDKMDITFAELLHALMKLEMQGIVYVSVLKENLRNVELLRKP